MGKGYAILIWEGWGAGLVRINPTLYEEGKDMYGNPKNWFPTKYKWADDYIDRQHNLTEKYGEFWEVIW